MGHIQVTRSVFEMDHVYITRSGIGNGSHIHNTEWNWKWIMYT